MTVSHMDWQTTWWEVEREKANTGSNDSCFYSLGVWFQRKQGLTWVTPLSDEGKKRKCERIMGDLKRLRVKIKQNLQLWSLISSIRKTELKRVTIFLFSISNKMVIFLHTFAISWFILMWLIFNHIPQSFYPSYVSFCFVHAGHVLAMICCFN